MRGERTGKRERPSKNQIPARTRPGPCFSWVSEDTRIFGYFLCQNRKVASTRKAKAGPLQRDLHHYLQRAHHGASRTDLSKDAAAHRTGGTHCRAEGSRGLPAGHRTEPARSRGAGLVRVATRSQQILPEAGSVPPPVSPLPTLPSARLQADV